MAAWRALIQPGPHLEVAVALLGSLGDGGIVQSAQVDQRTDFLQDGAGRLASTLRRDC
jgi:hypothetical protein